MEFRTEELAITVLPGSELKHCHLRTRICLRPTLHCPWATCYGYTCLGATAGCGVLSPCGHLSPCGVLSPCGHLSPCGPVSGGGCGLAHSWPIPPLDQGPIVIQRVEELKGLRSELRETVEQLDQIDEEDLGGPAGSVEDLDLLENKLERALEEVRKRRKSQG